MLSRVRNHTTILHDGVATTWRRLCASRSSFARLCIENVVIWRLIAHNEDSLLRHETSEERSNIRVEYGLSDQHRAPVRKSAPGPMWWHCCTRTKRDDQGLILGMVEIARDRYITSSLPTSHSLGYSISCLLHLHRPP